MMMRTRHILCNHRGFTMVEIVVAAMVFALSIAGLLAAVSSLNRPAVESFEEVQAAYVAKQVLEDLKLHIDARTWNEETSKLKPGETFTETITRHGIDFTASWIVTEDAAGGRWVDVTVSWN